MREFIKLIETLILLELMSKPEAIEIVTNAGATNADMNSKDALFAWRRKNLARLHPDQGGNSDDMALINAAIDYLSHSPDGFNDEPAAPSEKAKTEYTIAWLNFGNQRDFRTSPSQKKHILDVLNANNFPYKVYRDSPKLMAIIFPTSELNTWEWLHRNYVQVQRYEKVMA